MCVAIVFVHLNYIHVGDLTISDIMLAEDSANNEFTLTCISIGGPATTVTWTRDSETAVGERMTVFNTTTAATTAQYTHTLTVSGSTTGVYRCTVTNDKPSTASASITVGGTDLSGTINVCVCVVLMVNKPGG